MQLTVNVQQWVDTSDEPTALTIDAGGIVVGSDTNSSDASQLVVDVDDNGSVDIAITQDGYYSYEMTINNVYETDNEIYILLVEEITDTSDEEYLMPHAYFFYFRDPCSFDVDFYNASSFTGDITWYLNNECIDDSGSTQYFTYQFESIGDFQMKMATQTNIYVASGSCGGTWETAWLRQWANGDAYEGSGAQGETGNVIIQENVDSEDLDSYLETDLETNVTITEYRPTFTLTLAEPSEEIDDVTCYTQYESISVSANITLNREGANNDNATITWKITDPTGLLVYEAEVSAASATNSTTSTVTTSFSADVLGTYTIEATLVDQDCPDDSWEREITAETCNFVYIETTGVCSEYTIYNASLDTSIDYTIERYDGSGENPITGTLDHSDDNTTTSVDIELTDVGIHTATITWYEDEDDPTTQQEQILIINNWCGVWDCLAGYVNEVLCNPEELCNPCPDALVLNEMVLFVNTYQMLMNMEYEFNNFYSALDDSDLARFQTMNSVYDKISELCDRLNCSGPCISVTQRDKSFKWGLKGTKSVKSKGCSSC